MPFVNEKTKKNCRKGKNQFAFLPCKAYPKPVLFIKEKRNRPSVIR